MNRSCMAGQISREVLPRGSAVAGGSGGLRQRVSDEACWSARRKGQRGGTAGALAGRRSHEQELAAAVFVHRGLAAAEAAKRAAWSVPRRWRCRTRAPCRSAAVANSRPAPVTISPPLTVAAVPVPVMPCFTSRRSSPSPFCHAIVPCQVVGRERRVGRLDDRRKEPEPVGHRIAFAHDLLGRAAARRTFLAGLQQPDDRRHVEADDVDTPAGRVARRASPVGPALVARHVDHFVEPDRRERALVSRASDPLSGPVRAPPPSGCTG